MTDPKTPLEEAEEIADDAFKRPAYDSPPPGWMDDDDVPSWWDDPPPDDD